MKRSRNKQRGVAIGILLVVMSIAMPASAMPPPVEFVLEVVGTEADERRDGPWAMTRVDGGVATLCGQFDSEGDRLSFEDGEENFEVRADAEIPWALVWAVMWSDEPKALLQRYHSRWGQETARVEVADDAPVFCYGLDSKLCVDDELRRVVVLEVEVDDVEWALRVSGAGERMQMTRDGALFARFSVDARRCGEVF